MRNLSYSLIFLSSLLLPTTIFGADGCAVSQVAIISGTWESSANKISLTLQAQDSAGASCNVPETLRFALVSTGGGSFTSQSGASLSYYISKGSANRNFYYTGFSNPYQITANAGYGTADSWVTQFSTTYPTSTPLTASEPVATSSPGTTTTSSQSSQSVETISTHYSSASLSTRTPASSAYVSAGRDRLTIVGAPVQFKAETELNDKTSDFEWSFGDGSTDRGITVSHSYQFPGEYIVVLNTASVDGLATSRLKVRVLADQLEVVSANAEKIEIINHSPYEVNLFGRVLVLGERHFTLPKDLIVGAGQKVALPSGVTHLTPSQVGEVALVVVGDVPENQVAQQVSKARQEMIVELSSKLAFLEAELAKRVSTPVLAQATTSPTLSIATTSNKVIEPESNTATASQASPHSWLGVVKKFFFGK